MPEKDRQIECCLLIWMERHCQPSYIWDDERTQTAAALPFFFHRRERLPSSIIGPASRASTYHYTLKERIDWLPLGLIDWRMRRQGRKGQILGEREDISFEVSVSINKSLTWIHTSPYPARFLSVFPWHPEDLPHLSGRSIPTRHFSLIQSSEQ